MTREEFNRIHWDYYKILEDNFINTKRYIDFDLGRNYKYDNPKKLKPEDCGNSLTYSYELVNQYQAICSELDALMKNICTELDDKFKPNSRSNITTYAPKIIDKWNNISNQKVRIVHNVELVPFWTWKSTTDCVSPDWWKSYNKIKHNRVKNFKDANLKNVIYSLAGLYVLENYFIKYIADRDDLKNKDPINKVIDIPGSSSEIFMMVNFNTRYISPAELVVELKER